jgi:pimeloyl-ACP methyl ester carboxylesterase
MIQGVKMFVFLGGCMMALQLSSTVSVASRVRTSRGKVIKRKLAQNPRQEYFLYLPGSLEKDAKVLVTVHGISRNAEEQAQSFKKLANRYGVVLVAPLFPRSRFSDYQTLGAAGTGEKPDSILEHILAEVGSLTKADVNRVYLFGYSGGAQFVHRYTMAYPDRVAGTAVAAAGWYTFPDFKARFPRGLKLRQGGTFQFVPEEFLRVPMVVLVGERDLGRGPVLKRSRRLDMQQGLTRVERGYRWTEAMRSAAAQRELQTTYRFQLLPRSAHSFSDSMKRGKMGNHVFTFLFGPPPAKETEKHEPCDC